MTQVSLKACLQSHPSYKKAMLHKLPRQYRQVDTSIQMPESTGDNSFNPFKCGDNHTSDAENYPGGSGNKLNVLTLSKKHK